jgi:hypothetical protein
MSVIPPAPLGMIMRMGRDGKFSAAPARWGTTDNANAAASERAAFIVTG